tara:strand:- start:40 stop:330 length:291 start_codon:yes stop_codon:yes gene_type:complete
MTEVTITLDTHAPAHVDRVLFEALQRGVRSGAMKAESERWDAENHRDREARETDTILHAVKAGRAGDVTAEDAVRLGTHRTGKIMDALNETNGVPK